MMPCYECTWVVTGNSTNKGPFREEGSTTIRRFNSEVRDEDDLRKQIIQGVVDIIHEHLPRQAEPKYVNPTDLVVELGEIVIIGDD